MTPALPPRPWATTGLPQREPANRAREAEERETDAQLARHAVAGACQKNAVSRRQLPFFLKALRMPSTKFF